MLHIRCFAAFFGITAILTFVGEQTVAQSHSISHTLPSVGRQPPESSKPSGDLRPPLRAQDLLAKAITQLSEADWLETNIRHESKIQGIQVTAKGRLVVAKGNKLFYSLDVRTGSTHGVVTLVCDGETHWRSEQTGDKITIKRVSLAKLDEALRNANGDDVGRQLKKEIHAEYGLSGLVPVLNDLQERLTFTSVEEAVLDPEANPDVPVYVLEGEWTKQTIERIAPAPDEEDKSGRNLAEAWEKREGFLNIPRKCKVYLAREAEVAWPYRIEWFGPVIVGGPDELLSTMEFRNPAFQPDSDTNQKELFALSVSADEEKAVEEIDPTKDIEDRRTFLDKRREAEEKSRRLRARDDKE